MLIARENRTDEEEMIVCSFGRVKSTSQPRADLVKSASSEEKGGEGKLCFLRAEVASPKFYQRK